METVIRVRRAIEADAPALADLAATLGYPTDLARLRRRLDRLRGAREHAVFVAESSERVVGWIHVFAAQRLESDPFAELGGLVVTPDHQRRGVGAQLVSAAEAWARRRGLASLRVRSRMERGGAHAFYSRLGFEHTKSQAVFVRTLES